MHLASGAKCIDPQECQATVQTTESGDEVALHEQTWNDVCYVLHTNLLSQTYYTVFNHRSFVLLVLLTGLF